ncbi:MAG: hypothetical protein RL141_166 [Candidatus Parcubacteria bacterium]
MDLGTCTRVNTMALSLKKKWNVLSSSFSHKNSMKTQASLLKRKKDFGGDYLDNGMNHRAVLFDADEMTLLPTRFSNQIRFWSIFFLHRTHHLLSRESYKFGETQRVNERAGDVLTEFFRV